MSCGHTLSLVTEIGLEINSQFNWAEQKKAPTPLLFITEEKTLQQSWRVITSPCSLVADILNHSTVMVYRQISIILLLAVGFSSKYLIKSALETADGPYFKTPFLINKLSRFHRLH